MADADEDQIPRADPSSSSSAIDPSADPEDEAQDFRFLAHLTGSKLDGSSVLPRRGEKDFEPNPTQAQSNTLTLSREAMHNALSVERVLIPRNPVVGQYLPEPKDWRWDTLPDEENGVEGKGGRCVVVEKFRTTYSRTIGTSDYRNWTWLLPEEALFLLERGSLDVRWPNEEVRAFMKRKTGQHDADESGSRDGLEDDGHSSEEEADDDADVEFVVKNDADSVKGPQQPKHPLCVGDMPMSLQGAYASFIDKSGLALERYQVYAGLRRSGYIVSRAATWDDQTAEDEDEQFTNGHISEPNGHTTEPLIQHNDTVPDTQPNGQVPATETISTSLINRLVTYLFPPKPLHYLPSTGPLIYPGLYGSYNPIYRSLSLIPYHNSSSHNPTPQTTPSKPKLPYNISWLVYKPSPNTQYRKSAPPTPDFRVAVLDARTTSVPTASELGNLLDSMALDELPKDKRVEHKLKHGVRNVILAIVDSGLVSYLRFGDVCSGINGRVFETRGSRGGKRGGGWKKRGRGGKR